MHKRSHPSPNKRRWLVVWWSLVPWDRGASWLWRQFFEASWCHETSPSWLVGFAETNASHWALASCSVHPWLSEVFSANWTVNMHICAFINIVIGWVGLWTLVEQAIWLVDLCFGGWGHLMTVEGRMEAKSHGFPWLLLWLQSPLANFQIWSHFLRLACADTRSALAQARRFSWDTLEQQCQSQFCQQTLYTFIL